MVFLREVFLAELTESMNEGVLPLFLRLILPFLLTFLYHRRPDLYAKHCTLVPLLALYGVLHLCNSNTNYYLDNDPSAPNNTATNVHLPHSPTTHSDPSIRSRSGWRGWNSVLEMPLYKANTFQPAFQQVLYVLYFLSLANRLASGITGWATERCCGMYVRLTQCSAHYGGEQLYFYGMFVRVVSCFIVAAGTRHVPTWTTMLIPLTTSLTGHDGVLIVRDHLNGINAMIITYALVLFPSPFMKLDRWFIVGHHDRSLTDDIDFELSSKLSLRIDDNKNAGNEFWHDYFASQHPSSRCPEEAAAVAQVVKEHMVGEMGEGEKEKEGDKEGDGAEGKGDENTPHTTHTTDRAPKNLGTTTPPHPSTHATTTTPNLDNLLQEIDLPVLFNTPKEINTKEKVISVVESLNATFLAGWSRPIHQRKRVLMALRCMIVDNETDIVQAAYTDLHRPSFETLFWECRALVSEIDYLLHHIDEWTNNQVNAKRSRLLTWPSTQWVRPEPLGVVLILGSWMFPFLSMLSPLAGGKGGAVALLAF